MKNTRKNTSFAHAVYQAVRRIPKGETRTYKEIARRAGRPNAYRAVGNILNKNTNPTIPCHRVVRSDGKAGGYNKGTPKKKQRLMCEGVNI